MEPLKNIFDANAITKIAQSILINYPKFNSKKFHKITIEHLDQLELKERVSLITKSIAICLPLPIKDSLQILTNSIKKNNEDKFGISGFLVWPLTEFVAIYGISEFDQSMHALKEMTKVFTAEFAIRSFFEHNQEKTLKYFNLWVKDENEHVRRLVSEGSRPLLPWGKKLHNFASDPKITWHLLEILKNDNSLYVRKSVANHLNDHSKNHAHFLVKKLLDWKKDKNFNQNIEWIIKHAARTLIKQGNPGAFKLFNAKQEIIKVKNCKVLTKQVLIGKFLEVEFTLQNSSNDQINVIIDHEIHLLKSNRQHKIKCFKGKKVVMEPSEKINLNQKIHIKEVTTRKYYQGDQFWNLKINGISEKPVKFHLKI